MRVWSAVLVALASVVAVVVVAAPAQWVALALTQASSGRLLLADVKGSLWSGSGVLVVSDGHADASTRLALPGRLDWRVAPGALATGTLAVNFTQTAVLDQPVDLRVGLLGGPARLSPATLRLPASLLTALGAPFNTLRPGGVLQLSWQGLQFGPQGVRGAIDAEWQQASSRLTPVAPMGHYRLSTDGFAPGARLQLSTLAGPLALSGDGRIDDGGRLKFSGRAEPAAGTDPATRTQLDGLITLLGQRSGNGAQLSIGS